MDRYKYYCKYKGCNNAFRDVIVESDLDEKAQSEVKILCKLCNKRLHLQGLQDAKANLGTIYFGKFSSMSPVEKKKVLKDRSNEDFKKNYAEKKRWMDRASIGLKH